MMSTTTKTETIEKHGLRIELDKSKVIPDDPGADTPAMVYLVSDPTFCATLWCASGEGELDNGNRTRQLSGRQCEWLYEMEDYANDFLYD